jgi:anti-anti-sigma factor
MSPEPQVPPVGLTRTQSGDGSARLAVTGEIDLATVDRFSAAMTGLLAEGHTSRVIVDFEQVTFLDSSGVAALMAARRLADQGRMDFVVVNCRSTIRRVLEITGVYKALTG